VRSCIKAEKFQTLSDRELGFFMRTFLVINLFFFSALFSKEITLDFLFEHASKNALTLKMSRIDVAIESTRIEEAESGFYPTFNMVYNSEYTKSLDGIPYGSESVGGITIPNGTRYQSSLALQMSYNLYDFGATEHSVLNARLSTESKKYRQCLQETQLHQQILEKYSEALKASKEQAYKKKMLKIRKEIYFAKERLYKAGQYSKIDLGDEAIYIVSLERDVRNASLKYKQEMIRISELSYLPLSPMDTLAPLSQTKFKDFTQIFESTARARMLKKKIEAKRAEMSLNKSQQLPQVTMYGNYYMYASDPKDYGYALKHMRKKSWSVGVSVHFNIFNGFKDRAKTRRLALELLRLQDEYNDAKHSFYYENKGRLSQLKELSILEKKDKKILEKDRKKIKMINRLRENSKIDLISKLNSQYELLKNMLDLEKREIDRAATAISLKIANRGVEQCTQH